MNKEIKYIIEDYFENLLNEISAHFSKLMSRNTFIDKLKNIFKDVNTTIFNHSIFNRRFSPYIPKNSTTTALIKRIAGHMIEYIMYKHLADNCDKLFYSKYANSTKSKGTYDFVIPFHDKKNEEYPVYFEVKSCCDYNNIKLTEKLKDKKDELVFLIFLYDVDIKLRKIIIKEIKMCDGSLLTFSPTTKTYHISKHDLNTVCINLF